MTRPGDNDYYEFRTDPSQFSQGDIFEIAVAYAEGITWLGTLPLETSISIVEAEEGDPSTATAAAVDVDQPTFLRLVSYPLTPPALALLVTPTDSMRTRGTDRYGHGYRTLIPLVPVQELVSNGQLTQGLTVRARTDDDLANAMYLPEHRPAGIPESLAFLHSPITLRHELLWSVRRVIQLKDVAVRQLQRQIIRYYAGDWPAADQRYVAPPD